MGLEAVNHSKCMLAAFQNFRQEETMLDVTLACNGMTLKAHKLVLSSCSPFFKELFAENPCSHPIIILKNFEFSDLKAIIDFIYKGELSVSRERLSSALQVAEELQIRGLKRNLPKKEIYEKLYTKVCGKSPSRKKRKRHRHNSSDLEDKECVNVTDSDNVVESANDDDRAGSSSQPMDEERFSESEKDIRPVVLRVGESSTSNEESILKNDSVVEEEFNIVSSEENHLMPDESPNNIVSSSKGEVEDCHELMSENSKEADPYAAGVENSDPDYVQADEQTIFQEQGIGHFSAIQCSEEQVECLPSTSLSPKTLKLQFTSKTLKQNETKLHDEGKRFICSKCDNVFTSRINFMRHKAAGHNNVEKTSYSCHQCTFTSEEADSLKNHLVEHLSKVPYECSTCSEAFASEDLYKKHLTLHEMEALALRNASGQDLYSSQNVMFRCSICFSKFSSKLQCQIHEKSCQGGN